MLLIATSALLCHATYRYYRPAPGFPAASVTLESLICCLVMRSMLAKPITNHRPTGIFSTTRVPLRIFLAFLNRGEMALSAIRGGTPMRL
jgi:hypothetical protein